MSGVEQMSDGWPAESVEDDIPITRMGRFRAWLRRMYPWLAIASLILLLGFLFLWPRIVVTIREGQEGVLWRRFGQGVVIDTVYLEGTHFIFPWNTMTIYEVRLQRADATATFLAADGLPIKVNLTIRYRPTLKTVPQLHQQVGPQYLDRVILPEVLTVTRQVMGQYKPEQLYALRTDDMQREIVARASVEVRARFVVVDDVLISGIELPEAISDAIQKKLVEEQEALQYTYRIQKEERERERKRIEAQGIQDFQRIVNSSITAPLLRWKGIEATLELAKSPNAKVVVVGNSSDGLPLILNMPGLGNTLSAPETSVGGSSSTIATPSTGTGGAIQSAPAAPAKSTPAKKG